jgi:hypothetical protein
MWPWFKANGKYWMIRCYREGEEQVQWFHGVMKTTWENEVIRDGNSESKVICAVLWLVDLKESAILPPDFTFFNIPVGILVLPNLPILTLYFCSPPDHASTISLKFNSLFLNIFPCTCESQWDKIWATI